MFILPQLLPKIIDKGLNNNTFRNTGIEKIDVPTSKCFYARKQKLQNVKKP